MFLRGLPPVLFLSACNRKERYRMAPPLRKPAGAQVAPLRCLTLRLLAPEVYHDWRMFSRVLNSIVLDMGSTLALKQQQKNSPGKESCYANTKNERKQGQNGRIISGIGAWIQSILAPFWGKKTQKNNHSAHSAEQ